MNPVEIEVFRADTRASRGITAAQVAEVAEFDCASNPIGICFGHPKSDTPAAGAISKLRAEGSKLFATVSNLTTKAVDGIKSGEWLNRSFAFFDPDHEANPTPGKWAPRHLGLLGASAPGIPGMTPLRDALKPVLAFDADGNLTADGDPAEAVIFSSAPTPTSYVFESKEPKMEKTPEQIAEDTRLAALATAQEEREKTFAARVKTSFEAANGAAIDALVGAGKVLPAEVDGLKLAFNALDPEGEELTFGAGDKTSKATAASHLLAFMAAALPKRVPLGRESIVPSQEFSADAPKTGADFVAQAEKLAKDKGLSFEAAAAELESAGQ